MDPFGDCAQNLQTAVRGVSWNRLSRGLGRCLPPTRRSYPLAQRGESGLHPLKNAPRSQSLPGCAWRETHVQGEIPPEGPCECL
jgi:hypothetical protein